MEDKAADLCAGHFVVRRSQPPCGDAPSSRLVAGPNLWPRHLLLFMRCLLVREDVTSALGFGRLLGGGGLGGILGRLVIILIVLFLFGGLGGHTSVNP